MSDGPSQESFDEFKGSFSYGSRTDLNFKFLAGLSEEDAARFIISPGGIAVVPEGMHLD